jgi:RNA polymerase sigma factor (sigma-70 family)
VKLAEAIADSLARRWSKPPPGMTREDIHASALVGAWEGLERHDPSKGASARTHASKRAYGAVMDDIRRSQWGTRHHPRHAFPFDEDDYGRTFDPADPRPGPDEVAAARDEVARLVEPLAPRTRLILRMLLEGHDQASIARHLGYHKSIICRVLRAVRRAR